MKKLILILSLLTVNLTVVSGLTPSDSITIKKVFGGYTFFQGEKRLNMTQLVNTLKPNEQAYTQIKSAQSNYIFGAILGGVGGFMVGYPLGTALAGGEPNWTMAGIGAGLVIISIPVSIQSGKKAKQAVETFNNGLMTSTFWDNSELKVSLTGYGVGLTLRFP
jgi:hypothetical protein